MAEPNLEVDYLVIGSGIAGLWFAHRASSHGTVLVLTKKQDVESATNYAQGGIASAVADNDSPLLHGRDTLKAGSDLARPEVVQAVTESGPGLVNELYRLGVRFTTYRDAKGEEHFDLGREGGHHRRRILHAQDFTGLEIERGLLECVRSRDGTTISEDHFAVELLLDAGGRCAGALAFNTITGELGEVRARVTMLATGGIGQMYRHTTNPPIATGDGIAMGYRAGTRIANMEFIQFHPTSLYGHTVKGRAFLVSEAVRGEGAILRTSDGAAFMDRYHPDGSLAPRDVVARAIDAEMKRRGEDFVTLDATHLSPERLEERFPTIFKTCKDAGFDMSAQPIPVVPAAHYVCGGIEVSLSGETSVPALFAAGECACTGLHGANRLASNSLLEALVFADRAAARASETIASRHAEPASPDRADFTAPSKEQEAGTTRAREELRDLMWKHAGIVRDDAGLEEAARRLDELEALVPGLLRCLSVDCLETANLLAAARLAVTCARRRRESRGLHYNRDHPDTDVVYAKDTVIAPGETRDPA